MTRNEFFQILSENQQLIAEIKASVMESKHEIDGKRKQIHALLTNPLEQIGQMNDELVAY